MLTQPCEQVMLNGKPWSSSLRRVSAYIQQDDVLPAHLTPLEHLTIMAKLRMDRKVTDEERAAVVQEVRPGTVPSLSA